MGLEAQFQVVVINGKGGGEVVGDRPPDDFPATGIPLHWIHVDYSQTDALAWIAEADWLDSIVKDNLLDDNSRPRCEVFDDGLFLALRGINFYPESDPEDMIAVRIWATNSYIITSSRRKLLSIQDVRESLGRGKGPVSASTFLAMLIESISNRIEGEIENLEDKLEYLEDSLDNFSSEQKAKISDIRRRAIRLKRYLSPQQDALQHMLSNPPRWLEKNCKRRIRESIYQLRRYLELLDFIMDRAIVAHEELLTNLSEELGYRIYILSFVATLFLPLGFLTGLFGINVGGIPGAQSNYGFLFFCLSVFSVFVFLIVFFKRKHWI